MSDGKHVMSSFIVPYRCRVEGYRDGSHAFAMFLVDGRTGRELRFSIDARQAAALVDEPDRAMGLRAALAGRLRERIVAADGLLAS